MKVTRKVHGELMAARREKRVKKAAGSTGHPGGPKEAEADAGKVQPREFVQLASGERFRAFAVTDRGVETEMGEIPWNEIEGFWTWTPAIERRVFVPVDHREEGK